MMSCAEDEGNNFIFSVFLNLSHDVVHLLTAEPRLKVQIVCTKAKGTEQKYEEILKMPSKQ